MEKKNNLHGGHRERMINKFLEYPSLFSDHELLEILLFYALPRKDTNKLAHMLIATFGSLERVFKASANELKMVKGVGDGVAAMIILFGEMLEKYKPKKKENISLSAPDKTYEFICSKLKGKKEETFLFVLIDGKYNVITTLEYTENRFDGVEVKFSELVNSLIVHKPKHAIIAHNHPSGVADSSSDDDFSTKKFNLLCTIHGVNLIDHIIYADGRLFSYRWTNKMSEIKDQTNVEKIMAQIKEKHYGNSKN